MIPSEDMSTPASAHSASYASNAPHAVALLAQHAEAMRVIQDDPGIVPLGQRQQLGQRRKVAVHAEHPVGDDHCIFMPIAILLEKLLNMANVIMPKFLYFGGGEVAASKDASMAQVVDDN